MEITSQLYQKIQFDLKQAMLARQNDVRDVLRMVTSELKNAQIDNSQQPLTDEQVIEVLMKLEKQRKDSIAQYTQGGREDLAESERRELEIMATYLPQKMSPEELETIIKEEIEKLGASPDMGAIMKVVIPRVKGRADGNDVRAIVQRLI